MSFGGVSNQMGSSRVICRIMPEPARACESERREEEERGREEEREREGTGERAQSRMVIRWGTGAGKEGDRDRKTS